MPTYEYRCLNCKRRFSVFMSYSEYGQKAVICPHCKSDSVERKIGRVRVVRADGSRLESLADPSNLAGLDEDPQALGRMMREMSKETGEAMGPEFDEVINRLEAGQTPEQIEKEVPDLGGAGAGGDEGSMGGMDAMGGDDF
jgi:putative FmdB family regulatory protein